MLREHIREYEDFHNGVRKPEPSAFSAKQLLAQLRR
jgi:hypothetical protein